MVVLSFLFWCLLLDSYYSKWCQQLRFFTLYNCFNQLIHVSFLYAGLKRLGLFLRHWRVVRMCQFDNQPNLLIKPFYCPNLAWWRGPKCPLSKSNSSYRIFMKLGPNVKRHNISAKLDRPMLSWITALELSKIDKLVTSAVLVKQFSSDPLYHWINHSWHSCCNCVNSCFLFSFSFEEHAESLRYIWWSTVTCNRWTLNLFLLKYRSPYWTCHAQSCSFY